MLSRSAVGDQEKPITVAVGCGTVHRPGTQILLASAFVAAALAGCLAEGPHEGADGPALSTGLVATVHPLVAAAGAEMLKRGGNAADAAAAVQWALNVVEPPMSGLGGGALILLWLQAEQRFVFIDGREMAPGASTPDQFLLPGGEPQNALVAHMRGYAVGVPGTLRAFELAVDRYGTVPLADTFDPAIRIAEEGFPIDAYLASYIAGAEVKLKSWPASARIYLRDVACPPESVPLAVAGNSGCVGGRPLREGEVLSNPDLAKTFRLLQEDGPDALYTGPVASAIVETQAAREGRMVEADLARYEAKERGPLETAFRGARVVSAPPPSAGGLTMLEMLGILEPFDLAASGLNAAPTLHLMIEAMHLAYQDRYAYIGDADFVDVPVQGLLDPDFHAERRALIDPGRANPEPRPGDPWVHNGPSGGEPGPRGEAPAWDGNHTTHFVVVDGWGNVAAVTTTIESGFGTGMTVPGYGFLLNNELTDFDFRPGGPNQVEPYKRPRSSMTPTIVLADGKPVLALGSPGGTTITTTVMQVLLNVLEHGLALGKAVEAARIYSSDHPAVSWESGISQSARDELASKGHQPAGGASQIGNVQSALLVSPGTWFGVADNRAGQGAVAYVPPSEVRRGTG